MKNLAILIILLAWVPAFAQWSGTDPVKTDATEVVLNNLKSSTATLWFTPTNSGPGVRGNYYIRAFDWWGATLHFKGHGDGGDEKLDVTVDGKFGIGTETPGYKLVVNGNSGVNQFIIGNSGNGANIETLQGNILLMRNLNTGAYNAGSSLAFGTGESAEFVWAAVEGLYTGYTAGNHGGDLRFLTKMNNTLNLSERMRITKNGNVGIGTSNPAFKLEVNGGNGVNQLVMGNSGNGENIESFKGNVLLMRNLNTGAYNAGSSIAFGTGESAEYVWAAVEGLYTGYTAGNHGGDLRFLTKKNSDSNLSERMRITKTGNVGIGKVNPSAKLHVDGTIISEEVKVENVEPADFVFDQDYDLRPLHEIEAFIKVNQHLPEVPSAKEMQENGVELGKMNMLLLQKIEELTLHTIEQQKTINELLNRIEKLESNENK